MSLFRRMCRHEICYYRAGRTQLHVLGRLMYSTTSQRTPLPLSVEYVCRHTYRLTLCCDAGGTSVNDDTAAPPEEVFPKRANCISDLARPQDLHKRETIPANVSEPIRGKTPHAITVGYIVALRAKVGPCLASKSRALLVNSRTEPPDSLSLRSRPSHTTSSAGYVFVNVSGIFISFLLNRGQLV